MNGLKPIKIPSAKEKVASELRKAILSRKMKEGEILSLDSVATQLNVSITPVREAFQILARDGLIKLRQNKGAIVLGITDTYIREHYQLRAILESACAGLAAEEGVDISGIRDSYEESKAALGKGDYSQYASQNRDFHSEIWAAAGNKKMGKYDRRTMEWIVHGKYGDGTRVCKDFHRGTWQDHGRNCSRRW